MTHPASSGHAAPHAPKLSTPHPHIEDIVSGLPPSATLREVATAIRVSERTIHRWVAEGLIPAVRVRSIVRIPRRAVADFLAAREDGAR